MPTQPATRAAIKTIHLATPSARYPILIGPHILTARLARLCPGRPFIVTSPSIWDLHAAKVLAAFPQNQLPTILFHPPGEKHKRLAALEALANQLVRAGASRDSVLIAFGGGVIGDLTGFLAAIYMRGIPYLQVPTTLLAQVDSSVGGKTGVNLASGKNLIGSFHHPLAVLADTSLLATLPPRELRAGLQESIKAGIIASPTLFRLLETHAPAILAGDPAALARVIALSVQVKANVVTEDERESGLRMILNFGHTVGHAIEAATGYQQLLHGEAVAWGSLAALHLARARASISPAAADRMAALIRTYGPLPRFKASAQTLLSLTAADKKARAGQRRFILPTAIGAVRIADDVADAELLAAIQTMLAEMRLTGDPQ